jgi:hypothetical protein
VARYTHQSTNKGVVIMGFNPDNIKVTSGRDNNYRSGEVGGTRPKGDPKGTKEFKKVLAKDSEEEGEENPFEAKGIIEESDGAIVAFEGQKKKKVPMSLFDLTGTKNDRIDTHDKGHASVESPASIYAKMSAGETKPVKERHFDAEENVGVTVPVDKEDKFTTRFSTEQTDLSYVNPLAAGQTQINVNLNVKAEKATLPVSHMQEIINQMVDKVAEMKNVGTTETIVTLKHPPAFAGATIVVTAFDNAKNEFNISIENLTQAAKNMMDMQNNRDSLLLALEQKGYAVHILATTTVSEDRPVNILTQEEQSGQQQQRNPEREGRPRKEKEQG